VLASAVNDTAYVGLFDENLKPVARRTFKSPMYAMHVEPGRLFVVGRNPYGYDINIIPIKCLEDLESFEKGAIATHHYRVAKQSEKIKSSDPVGIGLTAVAVAVVFLALVCISLILQGSGKLMSGMDDKKKKDNKKGGAAVKAAAAAADKEGEIYAAIAAAIHLYNDELHDEEDAVITIQKVEREWTPWNAKYYNMNQYFNNRR
jgi:sodium pump decarboxylase gamma subunit